jgi:protoporphyrinogen oxidase
MNDVKPGAPISCAHTLILGGGLAGISASFHVGHSHCTILEKEELPLGHIRGEHSSGFVWDPGPHVSFTKNEYVRRLFAASIGDAYDEYEVSTGNHYKGNWINHPAQTSLYQLPEPLRSQCLASFLESRSKPAKDEGNYLSWLNRAFGPVFAQTFPAAYTRKYWTRDAECLTTDWLGERIFYPSLEEVVQGSQGPLNKKTHYINKVRYPKAGGFQSFASRLLNGCRIQTGSEVRKVNLKDRKVWTSDGRCHDYTRLINTIPLPEFIRACSDVPSRVLEATDALLSTELVLVNVMAGHPTVRPENWLYVYDEGMLSTRINCTEKLTPGNAPSGNTGVQVEVYFSTYRPLNKPLPDIADQVVHELVGMGLIDPDRSRRDPAVSYGIRRCPYANVVFDHDRKPALEVIWHWLERFGLEREADDLAPTTDWDNLEWRDYSDSRLIFSGRFGQWKYYWTDDCVLRGSQIAWAHPDLPFAREPS